MRVWNNCVYTTLHFLGVLGLPYENHYGADYGDSWLLMSDANGTQHLVNFTELPSDTGRLIYGNVYHYLYTRRNSQDPEELQLSDDEQPKVISSYLDYSKDIKVVTHGWLSSGLSRCVMDIKDAYMTYSDYNVIVVDWSELAENLFYPLAALSTRYVGKKTAKYLDSLAAYIPEGNIHLIGHSLGAQVMGYAASYATENISRVTGLDPARPLFEIPYFGPRFCLESSDADFVDVIHTCGGILGYSRSRGHADFYPNGGTPRQPGCEGVQTIIESCSHGRAFELFAESVDAERNFRSFPCESWDEFERGYCDDGSVVMGEHLQSGARGDFYLATNAESKYSKD